jgi:OOP family OmpA-OmpF porin
MKMKKLILGVLLIASAVTYTSAQRTAVDASKWSIALKGGGTYYRVAPLAGPDYMDNVNWGAGLIIERTSNPLWGMGVDVSYLNYNTAVGNGKTIDPTLFGAVNLSNLLFPYREKAKANVYAKVGAGAALWDNDTPNAVDDGKGISPVFTASLNPEIALGRAVALGLDWGVRYYSQESLGGKVSKERFDDGMTLMATLRFNLGADHVRNMTLTDYYPEPAPVVMQTENAFDDSQLRNRLDNLDRQAQDIQNRLNKLEQDVKNLQDRPVGTAVTASFENIEFQFDSADLTEDSYPTLNQIASILKDNPTWGALVVKGHTDSTGPEAYNQGLSERRAAAVKDYLVSQGVSSSGITTEGYGESQPIATNDTREGRQANRRVEFEISK